MRARFFCLAALGGALAVATVGCDGAAEDGAGGATGATGAGNGGDGGADSPAATATVAAVVTSSATGVAPCTEPAQCDDQNPCTDDTCGEDGRCLASPSSVDDGDRCTIDACDPLEGPTHVEFLASDGDACTIDVCSPSLGTTFIGELTLLTESFAGLEGGWIAEPPWTIGAAEPSALDARGMADPELDFSAGDDDGIAGVVLGGSPGPDSEGAYYLESPEIDAAVDGSVTLEYRRWLGEVTAHAPTVEVWDGAGWIVVWSTTRDVADAPPRGDGWVRMQHDLTPHKGSTMRVRFGVSLGLGPTTPSWNLDDVLVVRRGWPVDADACTVDSCLASSGPRVAAVGIDDQDACTTDICHPQAGVAHLPVSCDGGNDGCCPAGCDEIDPDCAVGAGGAGGN